MSTPTQFRHYLISQDAAGANIELIRSAEQVCVLAFDSRKLSFAQCHVLLEPLRNRSAFEERARRLGAMGHPLLARVLEFGEDDGSPFYMTENVDGETLRALISRHESLPVWLAQRLTALSLAALHAVVQRGDFVTLQPLDTLRVLQIGARELRVCVADYRIAEPPGAKAARGRLVKSAFEKQAQFLCSYFEEQAAKKDAAVEAPTLNTGDFSELLHNLLAASSPELSDSIEKLRRKLMDAAPQPPTVDIAAPYKPKALLTPMLASYQEVARGVVQSVRVQSQRLDAAQPYALRGTLMKTGQNVFVEQVAPPLLAGMIPGEVVRQARAQPKGGKYPNLVPVIFVEEHEGIECMAETAVEGVTLAELLATRDTLDAQETYLVLAGVDAALAQMEKAARAVHRLRLEDIFLFTGFSQGRPHDAGLLQTKLNEWPGFSIVLRAHPCMHSMTGRGTDPAMLLPVEMQTKSGVEPLWNGGWMAALGTLLIGAHQKPKPGAQSSGEIAVSGMLADELDNVRQGSPSPRSSFLGRFARVLREHDLGQLRGGGFWQEVSGASSAQGHATEVSRAAAASEVRPKPQPENRSRQPAPAPFISPVSMPEMEESSIGFAEALIRGTPVEAEGHVLRDNEPTGHADSEDTFESSWSGFRKERPLWKGLVTWGVVAIALGAALAHLQGRAIWQRPPEIPGSLSASPDTASPQRPDSLPSQPLKAPAASPLLPPPPPAPALGDLPAPPAARTDALTSQLKQIRLAGGQLPENLKAATEKAARAGNSEAMLAMGNALLGSDAGAADEHAAFGWFQKAMQAGDANARVLLGQCYLQGWGTAPDHPRAVGLLTTAAKAGDNTAKDLLGVCYARGLGVTKDDTRAFQLCSDAYSAGVPSAYGNLGAMYLRGQGVAADATRAIKLFAEGAERGNAESMLQYARCLEGGKGAAADVPRATTWYQRAAQLGNAEASAWCQQHHVPL